MIHPEIGMKIKTNKVSFVLIINMVPSAKRIVNGSFITSSKIEKRVLHFVYIPNIRAMISPFFSE
jgi:hypothetical protein